MCDSVFFDGGLKPILAVKMLLANLESNDSDNDSLSLALRFLGLLSASQTL